MMTYMMAAAHIAIAALYLFLSTTGRPGAAAWCVAAFLAVTVAGFLVLAQSHRSMAQSQRNLIAAQAELIVSKDRLLDLLAEKAGIKAVWDAAKKEAQAEVAK